MCLIYVDLLQWLLFLREYMEVLNPLVCFSETVNISHLLSRLHAKLASNAEYNLILIHFMSFKIYLIIQFNRIVHWSVCLHILNIKMHMCNVTCIACQPLLQPVCCDIEEICHFDGMLCLQSTLVSMLPIVFLGDVLCLVHMCMLYSLYSFEYKWFNMGWELHRRLTFIESNWPYFIGFGLPLAVLTALPSSFFSR